jgi:uncharacterized protein YndB with AHSA1/START domain
MADVTASGAATLTLPTDEQILITREFDAPRHLVYKAYTEPELVRRWWHANRGEVTIAEIDLRVSTEVYEGVPQPEDGPEQGTLNTATFTEVDGRTTLTILVEAPSKDIRDAIIESGMEAGMQDALQLLEGVAKSLR